MAINRLTSKVGVEDAHACLVRGFGSDTKRGWGPIANYGSLICTGCIPPRRAKPHHETHLGRSSDMRKWHARVIVVGVALPAFVIRKHIIHEGVTTPPIFVSNK